MKSMTEGKGGLMAYFHGAWEPGTSLQSIRTIVYWICAFLIAFEMTAGALWGLLRIEYVRVVFAHLGYPVYLGTILGIWKVPFALVLFLPAFQRLKEWAYAGAVFNYTGAAASHFFVGYAGMGSITTPGIIGPLIFTVITIASWALRPPVAAAAVCRCSRLCSINPSDPGCYRAVRAFMGSSSQRGAAWFVRRRDAIENTFVSTDDNHASEGCCRPIPLFFLPRMPASFLGTRLGTKNHN